MLWTTISSDPANTIFLQLPLFKGLSELEKDTLLAKGNLRQFSNKQHLFLHGDKVKYCYIVGKGKVRLYRETPDGQEKTLAVVEAGHLIGVIDFFETIAMHQESAVAIEEISVIEFPAAWLKEAAQKHGLFALNLLATIARHAHYAELEAEHRAGMTSAQLVACFLERVCILHDFTPQGFELPYSKTLIASRLGMELETFSRTLLKLRQYGIHVDGTHVSIDLKRVENYVCSHCSVSGECPTHQAIEKRITQTINAIK